ncbi:MAG TPA: hypothetical protein VMZ91_11745, partial [Candidatus Paceibacterota bacterium]|nr:hypothetical protein [Candidatus Paceibacterota bacterium]
MVAKKYKQLPQIKKRENKSKHNNWIGGFEKGSEFFNYMFTIGKYLFYATTFITCLTFWILIYSLAITQFENFQPLSLVMIYSFRLILVLT